MKICQKTASLRSGNFSDLNSTCLKVSRKNISVPRLVKWQWTISGRNKRPTRAVSLSRYSDLHYSVNCWSKHRSLLIICSLSPRLGPRGTMSNCRSLGVSEMCLPYTSWEGVRGYKIPSSSSYMSDVCNLSLSRFPLSNSVHNDSKFMEDHPSIFLKQLLVLCINRS